MFVLKRLKGSFIQWWTGSGWSMDEDDAKQFFNPDEAYKGHMAVIERNGLSEAQGTFLEKVD